jgi:hypothetical protein
MAATVYEILQDCIQQALALERTNIHEDILYLSLGAYNERGRIIWDSWPFQDERLDEFTAPAADSDGIITFASNVDIIRAIKAVGSDADATETKVWNQDDLMAAANGQIVSSARFITLARDSDNCVRIRVNTDDDATAYKALALKNWTDAIVDPNYSASNPSATPTDYRVMTFPLYRAEPALRAYVKDTLREAQGMTPSGAGGELMAVAVRREEYDQDNERRVVPRNPMFYDLDWK